MGIKKVTCERTWQVGKFEPLKVGAEYTIEEHESVSEIQAFDNLASFLDDCHEQYRARMEQQSAKPASKSAF